MEFRPLARFSLDSEKGNGSRGKLKRGKFREEIMANGHETLRRIGSRRGGCADAARQPAPVTSPGDRGYEASSEIVRERTFSDPPLYPHIRSTALRSTLIYSRVRSSPICINGTVRIPKFQPEERNESEILRAGGIEFFLGCTGE